MLNPTEQKSDFVRAREELEKLREEGLGDSPQANFARTFLKGGKDYLRDIQAEDPYNPRIPVLESELGLKTDRLTSDTTG